MATVPYNEGVASVAPTTSAPDDYQHINPPAGAFGANVDQAVGNIGAATSKLGEFWGQVQTDGNLNDAMASITSTWGKFREDNRGADALSNQDSLNKNLDDIVAKGRRGLSPEAQLQYDNTIRPFRQRTVGDQVATYMAQQGHSYATSVNQATMQQAYTMIPQFASEAPTTAGDAPESVKHWIGDATNAAVKNATLNAGQSADPKVIQEAANNAEAGGYKMWIDTLAKTGHIDQAMAATEKFKPQLGSYYPQMTAQFKTQSEANDGQNTATANIAALAKTSPPYNPTPQNINNPPSRSGGDARGSYIYQGLMNRGFPPVQAAAIAGNVQQESEFRPWSENKGEGAVGLIQWRLDRREALNSFAAQAGKPVTDPDTQMDFLVHEMHTSEANTSAAFRNSTTVDQANAALKQYIRYGDDTQGQRLANARQILMKQTGGGVAWPGGNPAPQGQFAPLAGSRMLTQGAPPVAALDPTPQLMAATEPLAQPPGDASLISPAAQMAQNASAIPPAPPSPEEQTSHLYDEQAALYDQMPKGASLETQRAYKQAVDMHIASSKLRIEAQTAAITAANNATMDKYKDRILKHDNTQSLYSDIQNDDTLKPDSKFALNQIIMSQTGDRDAKDYGPKFWDAFKAIAAPYGAPDKIVDASQIYKMWGQGDITGNGATKLFGELNAAKKPETAGNQQAKASAIEYMKQRSSFDDEPQYPGGPPLKDPIGKQVFNGTILPQFLAGYDKWIADGKDPYEYTKKDRLDSLVNGQRSTSDYKMAKMRAMGQLPADTPIAPTPAGADNDAWRQITALPKTKNGAPIAAGPFAASLTMLANDPTPQNIDRFDKSNVGLATGLNGRDVLKRLGIAPKADTQEVGAPPAQALPIEHAAFQQPAPEPSPAAPAAPPQPGPGAFYGDEGPLTEQDVEKFQRERAAQTAANEATGRARGAELGTARTGLGQIGDRSTPAYTAAREHEATENRTAENSALVQEEQDLRQRLAAIDRQTNVTARTGHERERFETRLREIAERRKTLE